MPHRTLHAWFEHTAAAAPDRPALDLPTEGPVSYRDLQRASRQAADRILHACGTRPARVALLAERSLPAYAGYLAVLRLGAAVIPLNPANPPARNVEICALAGAAAVLVDGADTSAATAFAAAMQAAHPAAPHLATVDLAAASALPAPRSATAPDLHRADADDIAYVMFTSGSTGRPKGVPVRHRNIVPALEHHIARCELGPGSRVSHTYGLTFDPSVFDLFGAWCSGATLVVPDRRDLYRPVDYIVDRGLTHWDSVPSLVSVAAELGGLPPGRATGLRHSVFGGEPVTARHLALWREVAPHSTLHNQYGPTELAVTCTVHTLPADPAHWTTSANGTVPIGPVHPHLEALVVDEQGRPADEGELCVRGPQRFDGYLDPADNRGRFLRTAGEGPAEPVPAPGEPVLPTDWYRTGDRVRTRSGTLLHLGRIDAQVKILGNRVELGEVEAAVSDLPGVDAAAVVAVPGPGEVRLAAYYCGTPSPAPELSRQLRGRLPRYMVPQHIQHLDGLPLTTNGKIDRRRLEADAASPAGPSESGTR
ncbi:amino acid adenylation domain-containing protein [Streptomyces sp. NPDC058646]|uniref:amino acid adenylation domain-containing protein n=1 Tax=Streptomyces sp. NPDC058646 TaxID=3346574 RepID=UPI0036689CD3